MDVFSAIDVLKKFGQTSGESNWSVFSLYGTTYSQTFMEWCVLTLKENGTSFQICDLQNQSYGQLIAELSISFLGQQKLFWLGDLNELEASKKKEWQTFLKSYTGPHKIIVFLDQPISEQSAELPTHVDRDWTKRFITTFNIDAIKTELIDQLFERQTTVPLESFCQAMRYFVVADQIDVNELRGFLDLLTQPEYSLFILSQYFFARDRRSFNYMWQSVQSQFPQEFWLSFWSEQLWQAALFIKQASAQGVLAGKKGVTRLPFSFMQRDWKNYTQRELCAAHNFLYTVDYGSKNGYATYGLELFVEHWFCGTFAKK